MSNKGIIFSVTEALKEVSYTKEMIKEIQDNVDLWMTFGKKNSHILRKKLFTLFRSQKTSSQSIFMIFFFFSVIKNKMRVLNAFDTLPESMKAMAPVRDAKAFITDHLVQYTSAESQSKFAVVHLPTTMPGLDILCHALILKGDEKRLEGEILTKQTFAQIHIDDALLATNRKAQENFWNNEVKSSKNMDRKNNKVTDELKFHEEYYLNSAADQYLLLDINMAEVPPSDKDKGYSKEEILAWFKKLTQDANALNNPKGKGASSSTST